MRFLTAADGVVVSPSTCLADHTCSLSDSIQMLRTASLKAATPDNLSYFTVSVVPAVQPTITVTQPATVTEGSSAAFSASISGGAGPYSEQWYFRPATSAQTLCLTPSNVCGYDGPYSGTQVSHTWQAGGTFNGVLLVTDNGGRTSEQDFTISVADVAHRPHPEPRRRPRRPPRCPRHHPRHFHHTGADDTESLTVDWGDGNRDSFNGGGGNPYLLVPGMQITHITDTEIDFTVAHVYANAGTYQVTISDTDGAGGSASQATTETIYPQTAATTLQVSSPAPVVGRFPSPTPPPSRPAARVTERRGRLLPLAGRHGVHLGAADHHCPLHGHLHHQLPGDRIEHRDRRLPGRHQHLCVGIRSGDGHRGPSRHRHHRGRLHGRGGRRPARHLQRHRGCRPTG